MAHMHTSTFPVSSCLITELFLMCLGKKVGLKDDYKSRRRYSHISIMQLDEGHRYNKYTIERT